MVKMGDVWDRTVEVLSGRARMIGTVAFLGLFLPAAISRVVTLYSVMGSPVLAFAVVGPALSILTLPFSIWAQLAITAIATDPATTRADAGRQARARLLPAAGITFLLGLVILIALVPPIFALIQSGFDLSLIFAEGRAASENMPSAGAAVFASSYIVILIVVLLWAAARLVILQPVILNERLGLGAIRRSIALTNGLTWRIIGVFILFGAVSSVASWAVQAVVGSILTVFFGDAAGVPTSIVVTFVSAGFTAVAAVFIARLYVAAVGAPKSE